MSDPFVEALKKGKKPYYVTVCFAVALDANDTTEAETFLRSHLEAIGDIEINTVNVLDQKRFDEIEKTL